MIVAMSRRIAADLYDAIIELRPQWHDEDLTKGAIKVVMTTSSDGGHRFQNITPRKLGAVMRGINSAGTFEKTLAILLRCLLDYVPPIFGFDKFSEVTQNYSAAGKSFKEGITSLNPLRNIADLHIHRPAEKGELLPTFTQGKFFTNS